MNRRSILSNLKGHYIQTFAIVERNLKLGTRFKLNFILTFINPIIGLIFPLIVMGQIFTFATNFGPWSGENYIVFMLVTTHLGIIFGVMNRFPSSLKIEKFWKTLPAIIIAPLNRVKLLIGIFITHFILTSSSFIIFFIILYVYYPVSFFTFIFLLFVYFLIALIFAGIGLVLGILAVSKESIITIFGFGIQIIFMFSCLTMPFDFFPDYIQQIINLNPFYYVINFTRLIWIENNFIYTIYSHPIGFIYIIAGAITFPLLGLYTFNFIFKKYGITGY